MGWYNYPGKFLRLYRHLAYFVSLQSIPKEAVLNVNFQASVSFVVGKSTLSISVQRGVSSLNTAPCTEHTAH